MPRVRVSIIAVPHANPPPSFSRGNGTKFVRFRGSDDPNNCGLSQQEQASFSDKSAGGCRFLLFLAQICVCGGVDYRQKSSPPLDLKTTLFDGITNVKDACSFGATVEMM